ncbi:hypothetical protein NQ317_006793 [Molorchus minor]|uniref:Uncharacterized protein n=1 Tax=Molorchus minor TaxID=1323400 RepID=A0ABQ9IX24_9CUCU|nr:hypothetical protein NQ317_006793 [Molorchus minor]
MFLEKLYSFSLSDRNFDCCTVVKSKFLNSSAISAIKGSSGLGVANNILTAINNPSNPIVGFQLPAGGILIKSKQIRPLSLYVWMKVE